MARKTIPLDGFPISKAVITNDKEIMELSGQIGVNPQTKQLEEGIEKQTLQTLENIKGILEQNGWNLKDIVKTRIFLKNMKDYELINKIYSTYFTKKFPARTVVEITNLPLGALIEIECTATKG